MLEEAGIPINEKFEIQGINHLALVCQDMKRTVELYCGVLGMQLIKTINLPNGLGQHFFFDIGNGDQLAFFWFAHAKESIPGVSYAEHPIGQGDISCAPASMNHVAFNNPLEKVGEYQQKPVAAGIKATPVVNHDDSPMQASMEVTDTTFVRSIYFKDPDGILLEFAAWTRELDVNCEPVSWPVRHRRTDRVPARLPRGRRTGRRSLPCTRPPLAADRAAHW
jgi:catechol 2,3-dioxygenase-like lactoylglutathione lyase family enzyme|tara:strand:- start:1681 stop:2346 length:666 start_codon:yes stop_codon:yes gene_type:complete